MKATIVMVFILVVGTVASSATTATEAELERARLYTACAPMNLVVEALDPEDTHRTGLTEKSIENAAESRLRAARLFAPIEKQLRNQYLYIKVSIVGFAFGIRVELNRWLDNLGHGIGGVATVWDTGSIGTHGGDGLYILGAVSEHLDKFIASYLRANEAHC